MSAEARKKTPAELQLEDAHETNHQKHVEAKMTIEQMQEWAQRYQPGICMDDCDLPADKPKRRCYWHQLLKGGTDAEAAAAIERRGSNPFEGSVSNTTAHGWCTDCESYIPAFYLKTKSRCRGCTIIKDREYRDKKQYGLDPGERQAWYTAQEGTCFGCRKRQLVTGLAVHHSHLTGEPFYLACLQCNNGVMGIAKDDPLTLLRLALGMYLPPHKSGNMEKIEKIIAKLTELSK